MPAVIAWLVSYLIGSVPTAYVLARLLKGVDIRTVGSGNVGATNAARVLGSWAGVVVLIVDVLKGVVAVGLIAPLIGGASSAWGCGLMAVLGHDFPVWLGGRGGKGVATTIGAVAAAAPWVAVSLLAVWAVVFGACRYVSVASMAAALAIPVTQGILHAPAREVCVGASVAVLILVQHRANLQRLMAGTEPQGLARRRH
jgi:glycerol-3-phosphate acyltransferase PlsY